jgi:uncharacterized protein
MSEINTTKKTIVEIKDITAGAGALGLLGYGMSGVLLSLANAGIIQSGSAILGMAIFMGGFAMFTAGLMEWKKGNTYGMAAYSSYGLFWFSFAAIFLLPVLGLAKDSGGPGAMAAYLALWGVFTAIFIYRISEDVTGSSVCPRNACFSILLRSCRSSHQYGCIHCTSRVYRDI